jgi:hypothetical protein
MPQKRLLVGRKRRASEENFVRVCVGLGDRALTSVMLQMKFGMVGSALLPTCTYASTLRSSYLTSILGKLMFTLQCFSVLLEAKQRHRLVLVISQRASNGYTTTKQKPSLHSRVEAAANASEEVLGVSGVGEEAVDERGAVAGGEARDVDLAEHVVALGGVGPGRAEQAPARAGDGGEPLQRRPPQRVRLVLRLAPRPRPRERRLRRPHLRSLGAGRQQRSGGSGASHSEEDDLRRGVTGLLVLAVVGGVVRSNHRVAAFMAAMATSSISLSLSCLCFLFFTLSLWSLRFTPSTALLLGLGFR